MDPSQLAQTTAGNSWNQPRELNKFLFFPDESAVPDFFGIYIVSQNKKSTFDTIRQEYFKKTVTVICSEMYL